MSTMPIISRKLKESLVIGDNTFVTVSSFHRDSVRLFVDVPNVVGVWKLEDYDRYASDGMVLKMPTTRRHDAKTELVAAAKQAAQMLLEYGFDQGETFARLTKAILEVSEDRRIG